MKVDPSNPNWPEIMIGFKRAGISDRKLVSLLKREGVFVSENVTRYLRNGGSKQPGYRTGFHLLEIARKVNG